MQPDLFEEIVGEESAQLRLDVYIAEQIEDASRSFIQKVIKSGRVWVNGQGCARSSRLVCVGDTVRVELPPPPLTSLKPEPIPIDILYQDEDVVVVNKPSGLVVHPAPGHYTGTLVHAVLHHCPDFQQSGVDPLRPGVVHRLDRFTSGVMVVAKNPKSLTALARQAQEHTFDRQYLALVRGEFKEDKGRIDATIGRSLADPSRMSVTGIRGKEAVTLFEVKERFGAASFVSLRLETGRTHQIRVHLRFAGHPVLGDPVYGYTDYRKLGVPPNVMSALSRLEGQALHAEVLGFDHPSRKERMQFAAAPPKDFADALDAFREGSASSVRSV